MLLFTHTFALVRTEPQVAQIVGMYGKAERYESVETNTRRQANG
jgi:hypothetical protein